jgi:hypothetical protein
MLNVQVLTARTLNLPDRRPDGGFGTLCGGIRAVRATTGCWESDRVQRTKQAATGPSLPE